MPAPNLGTLAQPVPMGGQTQGPAAPAPATGQSSPDGMAAISRGKVMQAIHQISQELPNFPVGSEEHTALIDTVKKLGKYFAGWSAASQQPPQPQQAAQQTAGSPVPLPDSDSQQEAA